MLCVSWRRVDGVALEDMACENTEVRREAKVCLINMSGVSETGQGVVRDEERN